MTYRLTTYSADPTDAPRIIEYESQRAALRHFQSASGDRHYARATLEKSEQAPHPGMIMSWQQIAQCYNRGPQAAGAYDVGYAAGRNHGIPAGDELAAQARTYDQWPGREEPRF